MNSQKLWSIDNSIDRSSITKKNEKKKAFVIDSLQFRKKVLFIWPDVLLAIDKGIPFSDTNECKINFFLFMNILLLMKIYLLFCFARSTQ